MSIQKLDNKIVTSEIKQTSNRMTIPFRDSAIDKIKNTELTFGKKRHLIIAFDVPKGSSLKGLKLRVSKATGQKVFCLNFWINKERKLIMGKDQKLKN